ncbi:unnamed protein product, partial [marine sediment metagenome]
AAEGHKFPQELSAKGETASTFVEEETEEVFITH